jgi:acyl-CoA thioesterase
VPKEPTILSQIPNFLDLGDNYLVIASLNHTVIFHEEAAGLSMINEATGKPYYFISEEKVDHIGYGRGLATWRLWREDGLHVASCFQDGLLRMTKDGQKGGAAEAFETTKGADTEGTLKVGRKKEKL